jgi:hypothetical protein
MASMEKPKTVISRRALAAAVFAGPLLAQKPESDPVQELEAVRTQARRSSDQLRKFQTPVLLEPSFVFRP